MTAGLERLPAEARSSVYSLLATFYSRPLGEEMIRRLVDAAVANEPDDPTGEMVSALRPVRGALAAMRLAAEHTRLFGGVQDGYGPPPPYESVWREGRAVGEATAAVAELYRAAGYVERSVAGPCDHLGEELRFMAALVAAEAEAAARGAEDEADRSRTLQHRFLHGHLLAWVPAYCRVVVEQSREPFYAALARLTEQLLSLELAGVAVPVDQEPAASRPVPDRLPDGVPGDGPCHMQ